MYRYQRIACSIHADTRMRTYVPFVTNGEPGQMYASISLFGSDDVLRLVLFRAHLIGLKNICFQKIKNQSFHLIGRSVSTPRMVILIFRKFCFQPRSPGGLFLRNYICFIRSSCGLPHRVSQTSSHSTGTSISPETHTRTHGQARTVKYRGRCPTRRRTNRQPLGEQGTSTSANCVPAKRGRACCRREVRHQLTAAATGALLLVAGMTCSPQGKHEPLRMRSS